MFNPLILVVLLFRSMLIVASVLFHLLIIGSACVNHCGEIISIFLFLHAPCLPTARVHVPLDTCNLDLLPAAAARAPVARKFQNDRNFVGELFCP